MKTITRVDIPGFDRLYYATTDGEVFNSKTGKKLKIRKKVLPRSDSYVVSLYKNGRTYDKTMSWIMRTCFFGGRNGALKHKDGVKSNWALQNLKLCSFQEIGRMHDMPNRTPVIFRRNDGTETIYSSVGKAAEGLGVTRESISRWINGRSRCTILDGIVFSEDAPEKADSRPPHSIKRVVWERPDGTRKEWASSTLAAKELFCSSASIRDWCSGKFQSHLYEGKFYYMDY